MALFHLVLWRETRDTSVLEDDDVKVSGKSTLGRWGGKWYSAIVLYTNTDRQVLENMEIDTDGRAITAKTPENTPKLKKRKRIVDKQSEISKATAQWKQNRDIIVKGNLFSSLDNHSEQSVASDFMRNEAGCSKNDQINRKFDNNITDENTKPETQKFGNDKQKLRNVTQRTGNDKQKTGNDNEKTGNDKQKTGNDKQKTRNDKQRMENDKSKLTIEKQNREKVKQKQENDKHAYGNDKTKIGNYKQTSKTDKVVDFISGLNKNKKPILISSDNDSEYEEGANKNIDDDIDETNAASDFRHDTHDNDFRNDKHDSDIDKSNDEDFTRSDSSVNGVDDDDDNNTASNAFVEDNGDDNDINTGISDVNSEKSVDDSDFEREKVEERVKGTKNKKVNTNNIPAAELKTFISKVTPSNKHLIRDILQPENLRFLQDLYNLMSNNTDPQTNDFKSITIQKNQTEDYVLPLTKKKADFLASRHKKEPREMTRQLYKAIYGEDELKKMSINGSGKNVEKAIPDEIFMDIYDYVNKHTSKSLVLSTQEYSRIITTMCNRLRNKDSDAPEKTRKRKPVKEQKTESEQKKKRKNTE